MFTPFLENEEAFCFTYGDGVSDVNVAELINFHRNHRKLASVTVVQPLGRFGVLTLEADKLIGFQEKPEGDDGWINSGYFVLSPKVLDYIEVDATPWERSPVHRLSEQGEFRSFYHHGFWQPMDALRKKNQLETLWSSGSAPWNARSV